MHITKSIAAGLSLALIGTSAVAGEAKIYPYASGENFCPNGLQPITISGVICCGTPNTDQSYQSAMAHSAQKARKTRSMRKTRMVDTCAEGVKGCY